MALHAEPARQRRRAALARKLEELHRAELLTAEELAAKRSQLGD